jgi:hypothetical protein
LGLLVRAAGDVTAASIGGLAGLLLIVGVAGIVLGHRKREQTEGPRGRLDQKPFRFWANASLVAVVSLAVLAVGRQPDLLAFSPRLPSAVVSIKRDKLNRIDLMGRERGYYQDLGDVFLLNTQMGRLTAQPPRGWHDNTTKLLRDDFLLWEYAPSRETRHKLVSFTTNRWGMHDREYERIKHPGTFRIALVGSSHEVGAGVPLLANYENLTEERLNREQVNQQIRRYEILNFSVDGNPPLQKLATIDQRVFEFHPDLVAYVAHGNEFEWMARRLDELVNRGVRNPYDDIARLLESAGVRKGITFEEVAHRLRPHRHDMMRWIFDRLHERAHMHGSQAAVILLEKAEDPARPQSMDELAGLARSAHVPVIDLMGAFAEVQSRHTLFLAPWDSHPNETGHRLLADRLYRGLVEQGVLVARR